MRTRRTWGWFIAALSVALVAAAGFAPRAAWATDGNVARIGDQEYATVQEAIDSVESDEPATIELLANVTGEEQMKFVKPQVDITVDLAGFTYTASADEAVHIDAADVTLTLKNGTIENNAEGNYSDGLYAFEESNNLNLTLDSVKLFSRTQTLAVQGMTSNSNVTIRNSTLSSAGVGIYYPPKSGTLTIEGSTITGTTGIVLKGATLVVKDGSKIQGTGENKVPDGYYTGTIGGEGFNDTGDALYVESGYNDRPIVVDVQGGIFKSKNASAVRFFQKEGEQTTHERTIEISGGTFSSDVSAFLVAGMVQNENGTVVEQPDVATVGDEGYKSFEEAVAAASDGDTITLLADASTKPVTVNQGVTIDLGGNTLSIVSDGSSSALGLDFTAGSSILRNGVLVDARSAGNTVSGYIAVRVTGADTDLATEDVAIQTYVPNNLKNYNYQMRVDEGASLTLNNGTAISELNPNGLKTAGEQSWGTVGVSVVGTSQTQDTAINPTTATELTVNDGASVVVSSFGISGNGSNSNNTIISINGGDITSADAQGIYHPQAGLLSVSGGTITGVTGIEMRAGELTVGGGTVKGGEGAFSYEPNGNGSTTENAAIVVAQHTTKLPIEVNLWDGTFEGTVAFAQADPQGNADDGDGALDKIELSITGGEFKGGIYSENFKDVDGKGFVSGGSFSDRAVGDFLAHDAAVAVNDGETPYDIFPSTDEALENGGAHTVVDRQGNTWVFADKDAASSFAGESGSTVKTVTHTVTFDDCLPTTANTVVEVENGSPVARPTDPACEGWKFLGWYEFSNGSYAAEPYGFAAPVRSDLTLYAKWEQIEEEPEVTPQNPSESEKDDGLAQTGDVTSFLPAVVAGAAGLTAAAAALTLRRRSK